jgi:hypothetical protein
MPTTRLGAVRRRPGGRGARPRGRPVGGRLFVSRAQQSPAMGGSPGFRCSCAQLLSSSIAGRSAIPAGVR